MTRQGSQHISVTNYPSPSHLYLINEMAMILNDYHPSFSWGTIRKQERCQFPHSHIDLNSVYPSDVALISHMEGPMCHQDALSEYYNMDAMWGLLSPWLGIFIQGWLVRIRIRGCPTQFFIACWWSGPLIGPALIYISRGTSCHLHSITPASW